MEVCLLRVGIDTGTGRMLGPLFKDGTFEYIPIPEESSYDGPGVTYGELIGQNTKEPLWKFFPKRRQADARNAIAHYDPEFQTFTYGDPTVPKRSLRELRTIIY